MQSSLDSEIKFISDPLFRMLLFKVVDVHDMLVHRHAT